ncbi:hypothetical protein V1478_006285 [Vespula squamosa]|uniref:Uncharacterized protein n=1 Tax=Vespula squamosa TaxID=30214 RepID=A0ABD2B7E1_VESSQ
MRTRANVQDHGDSDGEARGRPGRVGRGGEAGIEGGGERGERGERGGGGGGGGCGKSGVEGYGVVNDVTLLKRRGNAKRLRGPVVSGPGSIARQQPGSICECLWAPQRRQSRRRTSRGKTLYDESSGAPVAHRTAPCQNHSDRGP